ncbi:MAG: Mur ligase family protein [Candidatus Paceibacterota bacterium]
MNFLKKLVLKFKKPVVIGIGGNNKAVLRMTEEVLDAELDQQVKSGVGNFLSLLKTDVLIFEVDKEPAEVIFNEASKAILVGTAAGNIPPRSNVFAAKKKEVEGISKLAKELPSDALFLVNYDDETMREIIEDKEVVCDCLQYGLDEGAEVRASDIKVSEKGTSFKLNYEGNTVPVWLKNLVGKRQIYSALATCSLGVEMGLNLVDINQSLKVYEGIKGEGQLKPGIKKSRILDDSANADPFSMDETLMILSKIKNKLKGETQTETRKIAVLGDILKVGKYAVEAHQALGERAAENVDLLIVVGPRAKFIGNEAEIQGMEKENIFHFNDEEEAAMELQEQIEPSDLILIDGAAEMDMEKIVEEVEAH